MFLFRSYSSRICASSFSAVYQSAFAKDAIDSGMLLLLYFVFVDEKSLQELITGAMVEFNAFF